MEVFRVGVIADVHVGSMFGIWPPDMRTSSGGIYKLNRGQEYLWENWLRIAEEIPPLDVLIWNGDMVDGKQPKEGARFVLETDIIHQAKAFLEAARPFQKKVVGVTYVTRGSCYHDVEDSATEMIAYTLNARQDVYGRYSHDWLLFEACGLLFDVAHSQSVMMRYITTPLEREGQFSDMAGLHADVIVRSHSHQMLISYIEGANRAPLRAEISTPAWQLETSYVMRRNTPNRGVRRNLGMVVIEVADGLPRAIPYVFPHPLPERIVIDELEERCKTRTLQ